MDARLENFFNKFFGLTVEVSKIEIKSLSQLESPNFIILKSMKSKQKIHNVAFLYVSTMFTP